MPQYHQGIFPQPWIHLSYPSVVTEKEKTEDSQKEKVKAEQKKEQKSMEEKTLHGGATEVKEEDDVV